MLTRRSLLAAFASTLACRRAPQKEALLWPRTRTVEGVELIELFPNDADETAPLIFAIHGMGDRPDRWVDEWRRFPQKAHIVLPRAFTPHGGGFSWFEYKDGMTDEQFGAEVGASEQRLWRAIAALAGKRKPIVTGFSQGAILSFAIAGQHPDAVSHAFPVSGSCPGPLLPKSKAAPLSALHGTSDTVLDIKWGREAVHAFAERGNDATMKEYEGVGHTITPAMRRDLWEAIERALPAAGAAARP